MFVYLSKKIAIPNGVKLTSIAWNQDQGYVAAGGEGGLLKVLKLESAAPGPNGKAGGNLSMNQTLVGHDKAISVVAWNDQYRKLTSSDQNGLIAVWSLHKGMWFEEMINNRNKSVIRDLAWNTDGTKVCIVYEDGAVIVGGVGGDRLWGKDMRYELTNIAWSPDGRFLLFGTKEGEVYVHDSYRGQYLSKVNIMCLDEGDQSRLVSVQWHAEWIERPEPPPCLVICYENGKMQLMRSDTDEKPFLIDSNLKVVSVRWNPQGDILAVAGTPLQPTSSERAVVVTQFFDNEGIHLRTLRVAGTTCGGVAWEGNGLRIALAVDSFIFFANVRPNYKFAYFSDTAVYAFTRPDKVEHSVMFWNVKSNERSVKNVRNLLHICASGETCLMVNRHSDTQQYMVQLVNAIGGPLETRFIDLQPGSCAINSHTAVCCGEENIYIWQYRDPSVIVDALDPISVQASRRETTERIIHIEDTVTQESVVKMTGRTAGTNDLICAVHLSENYLFVARESGLLHIYRLDPLTLLGRLILPSRPQSISSNCDGTVLSLIDLSGVLTLIKIQSDQFSLIARPSTTHLDNFERKDVWNIMWAMDDPNMFAAMEKTKMYIFRGSEPEEPVQSVAQLCRFEGLSVTAIQLDDVLQDPDRPSKELVIEFETKSLRDTRDILKTVSMKEAFQYVDDHPHPKLWSLLAEHALSELNFAYAEMAVIRCRDYPTIQFVKRIKMLDDPGKKRAEVHAYYHRFDEADKVYKEMDRKDLALELRARLGDWFRVVQLVQEGGGDESLMLRAWENIGDYYADRQKWTKASQYYSQCSKLDKLAAVFYAMEDFEALEELIPLAEHDKDLLVKLGEMLLSVGIANSAAKAFLGAGEVRRAVDACVELNQWELAVSLAEEHKLPAVGQYLTKYATRLVDQDNLPQAIELYRKAGQNNESARLLSKLGSEVAPLDPFKAKQYFVLAAFEMEAYRKKQYSGSTKDSAAMVDLLNAEEGASNESRMLGSAWRGAEAYHYFLLCQRQILENRLDVALVIAMRLMDYDDVISPLDSYSLIALTGYLAKNFGICSKAFTRLEGVEADGEDGDGASGPARPTEFNIDFSSDLDVTKRTMLSTAMLPTMTGTMAGTMLTPMEGTATSFQLNGPLIGNGTGQMTYPTIPLSEARRRFGDLAVKIFTKHPPDDTSIDRVRCPKCSTFNKEWCRTCIKCQSPFTACMITGRSISDEDLWQCTACHHSAIADEAKRFKNCPLCHTPRRNF